MPLKQIQILHFPPQTMVYLLCWCCQKVAYIWESLHWVDALDESWPTFSPMLLLKLMGMGVSFPSRYFGVALIYHSPCQFKVGFFVVVVFCGAKL